MDDAAEKIRWTTDATGVEAFVGTGVVALRDKSRLWFVPPDHWEDVRQWLREDGLTNLAAERGLAWQYSSRFLWANWEVTPFRAMTRDELFEVADILRGIGQ